MMRTVVIDDEPNARQVVKNILEQYCKSIEIIGEADSVSEGVKIINKLNPDLVLLDIRMPDGTGFNLLKKVRHLNFHFVFITAYEEYAIQAIRQSALDYIVKPINTNELIEAVEKAELTRPRESELKNKLDTLSYNQSGDRSDKRLVLNTQESIYIVKVEEIVSCKADKNYTEVNIINGKKLVISKTLKDIEEMLLGCGFFRTHQSHLVNLKYIDHYEKGLGGTIIMNDSSRIPVSSRKKDVFLQLMSKL
ncbi:MAG: response regulator transcription factor [Bacteroidetes bacterium]|nr:response regulator transcription factor [Bacteroidota bacterium]